MHSDREEAVRFFVRQSERPTRDPQERAAMLAHRLESIAYQQDLLDRGVLAYAFRANGGADTVALFETGTLEELDCLIKRDPGYPYSTTEVVPVVSTLAMVREASEYLGEEILSEDELHDLDHLNAPRTLNRATTYWLAWKEVMPFSPLLSQEAQDDVHRRTVTSQRAHHSPIEFADDNPVGKSVGVLVAEGSLEGVKAHVAGCEVYPDTVITFTELLHLADAREMAAQALAGAGRCAPAAQAAA
jgi:muconolactone delta-isomerase